MTQINDKEDYLVEKRSVESIKEDIEEKLLKMKLLGRSLKKVEEFDVYTSRKLARQILEAIASEYPEIILAIPIVNFDEVVKLREDMILIQQQLTLRRKYDSDSLKD